MTKNISDSLPNHPWYYVPGKKYLSEQRLATKHELDSDKQIQNEKTNKYYNKCHQEIKLFSNWDQNKYLVKYKKTDNEPPFGIENEVQIKINKRIYDEYLKNVAKHFSEYKKSALNYNKSFIDCSEAVNYLFQQVELYDDVKNKRENFFSNWKRYLNSRGYNYTNDPLRQICFQIREMLYFYKSLLSENLKRFKEIYMNDFFSPPEKRELQELNKRCLQIIDMYLNLNEMRDHHFQNMFYEERESHWSKQKFLWTQEIKVWDSLFVKLFDSNYLLVRNRIEEILDRQRMLLKERLGKLEQLRYFIEEANQDEKLKPILYMDVDQLQ